MAAALAKVIRGGRSGAYSQPLLAAIGRRILKEVAFRIWDCLLPPPLRARALPFGRCGVVTPGQQNLVEMYQFSSKRSYMAGTESPFGHGPDLPWGLLGFIYFVSVSVAILPTTRLIRDRMFKEWGAGEGEEEEE